MTNDVIKAAEASGGKVLGVVKFPLNSSDFASYLTIHIADGASPRRNVDGTSITPGRNGEAEIQNSPRS